jgi:hypothetical protein
MSDELLDRIDREPELLLQLSPRGFEELMTELYADKDSQLNSRSSLRMVESTSMWCKAQHSAES